MSTISKIPIPVPKTLKTFDTDASNPIAIPPAIVTAGMYLLSRVCTELCVRLKPGTCTSASNKFFAAAFGDRPPTQPTNDQIQ